MNGLKRLVWAVTFLSIAFGGAVVFGVETEVVVKKLVSKDAQEVNEARDQILQERVSLIQRLIGVVGDAENQLERPNSVEAAMFILGEMRAPEAVQALVANIAYPQIHPPVPEGKVGPDLFTTGGRIGYGLRGVPKAYRATEALIKIGEPCIPAVMGKLSLTNAVAERSACLGVLVGIRGHLGAVTLLEEATHAEPDAKKRAILEMCMERVKEDRDYPKNEGKTRLAEPRPIR